MRGLREGLEIVREGNVCGCGLNGCHIASERRRECFLAFHENCLGVRVLKYEAEEDIMLDSFTKG